MGNQSEEATLKQIELDWNKAIEVNDVASMARYMSDEWVIFSGNGDLTTKQMFIELVESGDLVHTEMNFEILRVQVIGSTGIVMQKGTSSGSWKGQPFSNFEIASTVFVKKDSRWLAIQTMLAPASN